jgi:hypothetical protein
MWGCLVLRTLERNKQVIYYALFDGKEPVIDGYGNQTGEYEILYTPPTLLKINVSAARGEYSTRQFGDTEKYDKVLMTDDLNVPITETSILWIDSLDTTKPHDYIVKKVAKSLNSVSIAVSKVSVSA